MIVYCESYIDFYLLVLLMIVEWIFYMFNTDLYKKKSWPTYPKIFSMLRQDKTFLRKCFFFKVLLSESLYEWLNHVIVTYHLMSGVLWKAA